MIKTAVLQLRTETDYDMTMRKAERMIREAASRGVDFAVLPEMFSCPYSREYFRRFASMGHESTVAALSSLAKELGIYIVGGTVPESAGGKIYNTCFVFDRGGNQIARHRKVHLFDCDFPGLVVHESRTFTPGGDITVFDTEYGKMGIAVCFDIRFPELWRAMSRRGARLVFFPAQFNTMSGPKHWECLLRTRAFDYQYYLVAASAARCPGFNYEAYGHSAVVDPSGAVLGMLGEDEDILYSEFDLGETERVRASFPITSLTREDVYKVAD